MLRRWLGAAGLVAAVAAGAATFSCRQIVGIGDGPPTELTTSICGLPYGTPACASCANTHSCSESTTCAADPSCASYAPCFGQCNGDPKCWASCRIEYPTTTPAVSTLSACMATSCEAECKLGCGAFAALRVAPDAATACQACLVNNACSPTRACAESSRCDALNRCITTCQTTDCFDACDVANGVDPAFNIEPDGGKGGVFGTYLTARSKCGAECDVGRDWSCAGQVSWPTPKSATITWNLWVKDVLTGVPTAGANVSVCNTVDCAVAFQTGVTDGAGFASLTFKNPTAVTGGLDYGLNGYLSVTSPSIVPVYMYWGFPLSEAVIDTNALPATLAELQGFYAAANQPLDLNRGLVAAVVFDCQGASAPGVLLTLDMADSMTRSFTSAPAPATATDTSAELFFTNVPVGAFTLTATPLGMTKAAATVHGYVRAQTVTDMLVYPTP